MTGVGSGLSYGLGYTDRDRILCNGTEHKERDGLGGLLCVGVGGVYEI